MIYILTIVVLLVLIVHFDLNEGRKKQAVYWFNIMTLWLILLSGLAYQVGSDIPVYMDEYHTFSFTKIQDINDLINFKDNRQPLWVLLEYICFQISSNFVIFKLVISIICNLAITRFILKHSTFPFSTLLFYGLILYLNLNFNALRQCLAVAMFLTGYDALMEKKWLKYYALSLCAFLFHSSAFICFFLPVLHIIPFKKKSLAIISLSMLIGVFYMLQFDMIDYVYDLVLNNAGLMPGEYAEIAEEMLIGAESSEANIIGMIFIAFQVLLIVFIMFFNYKYHGEESTLMLKMLLVYMLFVVLNRAIPVVFTRFMQYLDVFYCCLLPSAVIPLCRRFTKDNIAPVVIIALFAILPISTLLSENKKTGRPLMVQYYPYYSVFNPQIDPQRSMLFGSYRGD